VNRILVHSNNGDEMFCSMFAAFRLALSGCRPLQVELPDEVAWLATAYRSPKRFCACRFSANILPRKAASPALDFVLRIGEASFGEQSLANAIAAHAGCRGRGGEGADYDDPSVLLTSGTTGRSKVGRFLTLARWRFVITTISPT